MHGACSSRKEIGEGMITSHKELHETGMKYFDMEEFVENDEMMLALIYLERFEIENNRKFTEEEILNFIRKFD